MKKLRSIINIDLLMLFAFIAIGVIFVGGFLQTNNILFGKSVILETKGILNPEEGTNTNIIPMLKDTDSDITDTSRVTILNSSSTQISTNGDITYGETKTTATITYKIRVNKKTCVKKATVVIPATTSSTNDSTDTNTDTNTGTDPKSGTDTNTGTDTNPGTDTDTSSNTMPTGALNVITYGANGTDQSDDTAAINSTITAAYSKGGGTVWIPDGTYMIKTGAWIGGVNLKNNVTLQLSSNAILKVIPNSYQGYYIININGVSNAKVIGGKIIGDADTHDGTLGEWGMGIGINSSSNIYIADITIDKCWGDGIYIGSTSSAQNYSKNVTIERVSLNYNRRQGISVISAKDLIIRNSTISHTKGTMPQSGIDLEPNNANEFLLNVLIDNVKTMYNENYGVEIWFGAGTTASATVNKANVNITISNYSDTGSVNGGLHTGNFNYYINSGYNITIK